MDRSKISVPALVRIGIAHYREPIPPGGSAAAPSIIASRIGSGATPPEAELVIQSSRIAQSPQYPRRKGGDVKQEKVSNELPEEVRSIRTFRQLVDFVEKEEKADIEQQKRDTETIQAKGDTGARKEEIKPIKERSS